eukprot:2099717-Pyramimonas_sp.AAC.1
MKAVLVFRGFALLLSRASTDRSSIVWPLSGSLGTRLTHELHNAPSGPGSGSNIFTCPFQPALGAPVHRAPAGAINRHLSNLNRPVPPVHRICKSGAPTPVKSMSGYCPMHLKLGTIA